MPLVSSAGAPRLARVKTHRRPTVARNRGTCLGPRTIPDRRPPRLVAARIGGPSVMRMGDRRSQSPLGIELVRAILLIALAILAITVALPMLLSLAAAPLG